MRDAQFDSASFNEYTLWDIADFFAKLAKRSRDKKLRQAVDDLKAALIPGPDGFGGVWVQPLRKTRPIIRHTNNNIFRTMVRFNYPSFSLTLLFIFFALEKRIWTLPVHSGTMKIGEILRIDMRLPASGPLAGHGGASTISKKSGN